MPFFMSEICYLRGKVLSYHRSRLFLHLITILFILPHCIPCKANHSHLHFAQFLSGSDHVRLLV
ncbi:Uncharacterised protein [Cedecea neteri]|uniref:Uncharacterized protein n=1 Tax=Cedecea neteri TaxID=158822 RepID=A0A2X2T1P8_9ENTR|nr:Uncharacterised protein [Cedecea neteri]